MFEESNTRIIYLIKMIFFSATLFGKSKNAMLNHLFADVAEEEGGSAKTGVKKKGGSMQTISAIHRVSSDFSEIDMI